METETIPNTETTETKIRIRYGRDKKGRLRNTLATIQKGDIIYYGISKCNLSLDKFSKRMGTQIASGRALKSTGFILGFVEYDRHIIEHDTNYGSCSVSEVKNLLKYFESLL